VSASGCGCIEVRSTTAPCCYVSPCMCEAGLKLLSCRVLLL